MALTQTRTLPKTSAAEDVVTEFRMTDEEFQRISSLVFSTCGIVLKPHKRQMIYTRLARRLRALGMSSFTAYLDLLESRAGAAEQEEFANAVTTNLTSFFRESHHFDHLRDEVLAPTAIGTGRPRLRLWSAGCSTGEEPYSIALTALASKAADRADLRVLATDLDTKVLARAKAGVYAADRVADLSSDMRAALIRKGGEVQMPLSARQLIAFRRLNLLHDWPFAGPFDAIFCRNVLIYFDAETKAALVERFARMLTPQGVLYLGHSESLLGEHPLLLSEGRTIYRRRR
ncbi:MAG: protein-glutamate O-methyltransferase CheR [Pseudomonadota bacterium]